MNLDIKKEINIDGQLLRLYPCFQECDLNVEQYAHGL